MITWIVENWDPIIKTLMFFGFLSLVIFGPLWSERQWRKEQKVLIESGELRVLSHAEYSRAFGIENKLRLIKGEKVYKS